MNSTRIKYWDVIKFLAIFFVVWQHCLYLLRPDGLWRGLFGDPIEAFIVSFHMSLFMMVSGYFARSLFTKSLSEICKKKLRQLLLPSVSTYFIIGIVLIFLRHQNFISGLFSLLSYCTTSFWFLKTLFLFYLITSVGILLWRYNKFLLVVFVIVFLAVMPVEWLDYCHSISMYPFFITGLLFNKWQETIFKHKKSITLMMLAIYIVLFSQWSVSEYDIYSHMFTWDGHYLVIYFVRTLIGIAASIAFILIVREICMLVDDSICINSMAHMGTFTLGIYIFHSEIIRFLHLYGRGFIEKLNVFHNTPYENLFFDIPICLTFSCVILIVSIITVRIVRKNKLLKLVLLGEK